VLTRARHAAVQKLLQVIEFFRRLQHPLITSRRSDIHDPERAGYPPCPRVAAALADFGGQGGELRLRDVVGAEVDEHLLRLIGDL